MRARTRIGFGPGEATESVVVVQADRLNLVIPTLVVVPLQVRSTALAHDPTAVAVPAAECGCPDDQVALTTQIRAIRRDSVAPDRTGRLEPPTMSALDRVLRLILSLP